MNVSKKNFPASKVIEILAQGNARFVNGLKSVESFLDTLKLKSLAEQGQFPFAVLVTCSDSRIPIELVFDRGLGDLFVVRTFGTVIDSYVLASIEYAVMSFNIETIIVMGHSRSGAVRKAMEIEEEGVGGTSNQITPLVDKIRPAINKARIKNNFFGKLDRLSSECKMWEKVFQNTCEENIRNSCREVSENSKIVAGRIQSRNLSVIPAIYDLSKGQVKFELPAYVASKVDSNVVNLDSAKQERTVSEILKSSIKVVGGKDE